MIWFRRYPLVEGFQTNRIEVWINDSGKSYPLNINYGKKTDLLGLKQGQLTGFNNQVDGHKKLCYKFLENPQYIEVVNKCPLCGLDARHAFADAIIQKATYYRCPQCEFRFLKERLSQKALDEFYASDTTLSATLTDRKLTEKRVEDIVTPKVKWVCEKFVEIYGKKPERILDVGAGAGHFVYAGRKLGFDIQGIEPNKPSIDYCKEVFGIDLLPIDFIEYVQKNYNKKVDVITFWAVLEHIPNFMDLLKAAKKLLNEGGLIVVEVPRWSSLDTVVQKTFSDSVTRHLFPLSHIQIFSDSALATAFIKTGFIPKAAWYFGMDMYELTMQLARALNNDRIIAEGGGVLLNLQPILDQSMLSDTMVFAGTPQ